MTVNTKYICYNCFRERPDLQENPEAKGPCPYCGFDLEENRDKFPVALRAGTILNNRYIVGRVLGQGGFGITYVAYDTKLAAKVAVKEYMPGELATRMDGTTVSVMSAARGDGEMTSPTGRSGSRRRPAPWPSSWVSPTSPV